MGEYICPHCKRSIYDDEALLCLYCGENLKRGVGFMGKIKYPRPKVIIVIAVLIVVISFVVLLVL